MGSDINQPASEIAELTANILTDPNSSEIAKNLAASVIALTHANKRAAAEFENKVSLVLQSDKYNDDAKTLAASILAQSRAR